MKHALIVIFASALLVLSAAPFENLPTAVTQPDGSELQLLASGDEYANRLHDASGYTVIQSPVDGYYYFASVVNGEPAPSAWRVGLHDPASLGLRTGINISPDAYRAKVSFMNSHARSGHRGPNTGTVNNINVFIRFSDQDEFADSRAVYDAKFNTVGPGEYSLRNYFHQVSYDQLNYVTHHYPVCAPEVNLSYQDSHPRAYYMPYNAVTNPQGYRDWQRTDREHALLADAIDAIASQVPADLNIDADNDDYVDNVCFIIRGPHSAWNDLLWAHRWALYTQDAYINGKMVWDFTFQPENQNSVRTLCHEMFHSVGAPDLYHYTFNGITPAGCWDIMESGNGHMGMYMKYRYGGWIDNIPTIGAGTHTLQPITSSTGSVYKIPLSGSQYLVLEYRKQGADVFEEYLPGSGLLIYRVNDDLDGNADGPPDEVYIFRPGGSSDANGDIAAAAFSLNNRRTEFNTYTDPYCFLTGGNTSPVNIQNIGEAGDTITFTLLASTDAIPPVISNLLPAQGSILTLADQMISAGVSAPGSVVTGVEFRWDGSLIGSDNTAPYSFNIPEALMTPGHHDILVTAYNAETLFSTARSTVRVVDPSQASWFSWLTDEPIWESYGRGAVPIKAAVEFELGPQQYLVRKLAFNAVEDPWGNPAIPGRVNVKINRFGPSGITDETLLNIGDLDHPMNGRFEYQLSSQTTISGRVAVIIDLMDYQNMVFDNNGPCGKSWLTEPNRPWTDALGRGIIGAAAIELELIAPGSPNSDELLTPAITSVNPYPNPFNSKTCLAFELKNPARLKVSLFNLRGQKVRDLFAGNLPGGTHQLEWDGLDSTGREVSNGLYFYRVDDGRRQFSGKLIRIK
ncbi:MAG TPA: M6 family metalloprotease domain-containing protein [Candidatus Cloacimonadota bacterium]|nr:M6 family metalloprotease domain-containing protein [Candidatus Cloacimonadota bacterium]